MDTADLQSGNLSKHREVPVSIPPNRIPGHEYNESPKKKAWDKAKLPQLQLLPLTNSGPKLHISHIESNLNLQPQRSYQNEASQEDGYSSYSDESDDFEAAVEEDLLYIFKTWAEWAEIKKEGGEKYKWARREREKVYEARRKDRVAQLKRLGKPLGRYALARSLSPETPPAPQKIETRGMKKRSASQAVSDDETNVEKKGTGRLKKNKPGAEAASSIPPTVVEAENEE